MKILQVAFICSLMLVATTAVAKKEKTFICHVGNEEGLAGESYLDDPGCLPIEENGYFCPDAGKIDLIEVANANKHLNNPSHEYDGISDYLPADVGASGEGNEDSNGDGIDDGCEPLLDCSAAGGVEQLEACWFLGQLGQSCDDVCGAASLSYDEATNTVAGTAGTDANCISVLDALSAPDYGFVSGLSGITIGCFVTDPSASGASFLRGRVTSGTTSDQGSLYYQRACACE